MSRAIVGCAAAFALVTCLTACSARVGFDEAAGDEGPGDNNVYTAGDLLRDVDGMARGDDVGSGDSAAPGDARTGGDGIIPTALTDLVAQPMGTTSMALSWVWNGGAPDGFYVAYLAGAAAPDCNSATSVQVGGDRAGVFLDALDAGTLYTFVVCAVAGTSISPPTLVRAFTLPTGTAGSIMLVSSADRNADFSTADPRLDPLELADRYCQTLWLQKGAPGIARAMLTTDNRPATTRLAVQYPVRNSLGTIIEDTDLWAGSLESPPNVDENESVRNVLVWTGFGLDGTPGSDCRGWSTSSAMSIGVIGNSSATDGTWAEWGASACAEARHIYCLGQDTQATPPDPVGVEVFWQGAGLIQLVWRSGGGSTVGYRIAYQPGDSAPADCSSGTVIDETQIFRTHYAITGLATPVVHSFRVCAVNGATPRDSSPGVVVTGRTVNLGDVSVIYTTQGMTPGNFGGLDGGDSLCRQAAPGTAITGTIRAILSTDAISAKSRLTLRYPVRNRRGLVVAEGDLWAGTLAHAPDIDVFGERVDGTAWTGTLGDGTTAGIHCSGWLLPTGTGAAGVVSATDGSWASLVAENCTNRHRLYCIRE